MFSAGLIHGHRVSRFLIWSVLIFGVQKISSSSSSSSKDNTCFEVKDDGFFSKFKPQAPQAQNVADTCVKITDCKPSMGTQYREYDGRCNNVGFPMWGKAGMGLVRLLPSKYADGVSSPRKAEDGGDLPNARVVRYEMFPNEIIKDKKISYWFSVFGQWISHDTAQTATATPAGPCCKDRKTWPGTLPVNCSSTRVLENDKFYSEFGVTCLFRARSLTTEDFGCKLKSKELWNPVTAYIDSSALYGSSVETAKSFKKGEMGQLITSVIDKKEFPKMADSPNVACDIRAGEKTVCFSGGDGRASQNPPLSVLVTIFTRFHNDFAKKLFKLRSDWEEWRVFEETRRIVIAVTHLIVRKEWLPKFVGKDFMKQAGLTFTNIDFDQLYNPGCNAGTVSEFMHSAYRAAHSTILEFLRLTHNTEPKNLNINNYLRRPFVIVNNYDSILKSAITCPMAKQDKWMSYDMNNRFLRGTEKWGGDLETTSIEREREAGFGGYVYYIETLLQEPKVNSWDDLKKYFTEDTLASLKKVYKHYRDIDMYVGGVVECPVGDSLYGKLFTAIITDQFARWLLCDRHSPTLKDGPGAFTLPQLEQLNKIDMAYLVCKYSDGLQSVPKRPFEYESESIECSSLSDIDLSPWQKGFADSVKEMGKSIVNAG